MTVEIVSSQDGGSTPTSAQTCTLFTGKPSTPHAPKRDGFVTFFNEGGYVATFSMSYKINGMGHEESTGDMDLGNKKVYPIPGAATDVQIKAVAKGLPSKTVFDLTFSGPPNKCFKTYGTIFSPKWNNNGD